MTPGDLLGVVSFPEIIYEEQKITHYAEFYSF